MNQHVICIICKKPGSNAEGLSNVHQKGIVSLINAFQFHKNSVLEEFLKGAVNENNDNTKNVSSSILS